MGQLYPRGFARAGERARYFTFAAIIIAAPLQGCGVTRNESEAAGVFSKSASTLADSVKTAYSQAAQDEADLRAVRYVVGSGAYERSQSLGITTIKGRMAAANVLASYGAALSTLLDVKTQESDISGATDKLASAVKGIPSSLLKEASITSTEIDNAGKIFTVAAQFYLDYRRRQVLQEVVPSLEPIVTKLCKRFAQDFDFKRGGFAQVYYNTADRALDKSVAISTDGDFQHRAVLMSVFQRADAVRTKAQVAFTSIEDAASSCVDASVALRKAVADPTVSFDDILNFANKAEAAYSAVHAIAAAK